jgi:predicted aminopeptidase
MGKFPYLGFFKHDSALEYQKELEGKDYISYIRPVYAYSTLGYFSDTILSSFFRYDTTELAELVFHELFHTIFFIKDEVALNENLANYFAVKMADEYFSKTKAQLAKKQESQKKHKLIKKEIYKHVKALNEIYKEKKPKTRSLSQSILSKFLKSDFMPNLKKLCSEIKVELKNCYPLHRKWNNARFVAFLTYEQDGHKFESLHKKLDLNITDYFDYIEKRYAFYEKEDPNMSFKKFLFKSL